MRLSEMRFPRLKSQSEIDRQFKASKQPVATSQPLPWLPALFGLTVVLAMQALL
jgi:predicted 3-demethylubiquinone-9 3-methyltransferase (glyoxalase superfamily)